MQHPNYLVRRYERGTRLVDQPTEQFIIHKPDTRCVDHAHPEVYAVPVPVAAHMRIDGTTIKTCDNCLPGGVSTG